MRYRRLHPGQSAPAVGIRALPASRSGDVANSVGGLAADRRVSHSDAALDGATAWPAALVRVARRRQSGVLSLSSGKLVFRGARASAAQSLSGAGLPVPMRRSRLRVGGLRLAFASDNARDAAAAVIASAAEKDSFEEFPSTDGLSDVVMEKTALEDAQNTLPVPRSSGTGMTFLSSDYFGTEIDSDIGTDCFSEDLGSPVAPPAPRTPPVPVERQHTWQLEDRPSRLDVYLPFGRRKLSVAVFVLIVLLVCVVLILTQLVRSLARLHILLETY